MLFLVKNPAYCNIQLDHQSELFVLNPGVFWQAGVLLLASFLLGLFVLSFLVCSWGLEILL